MGPEVSGSDWFNADWSSAMQKAQSELLRQWTDLGTVWSKTMAATGATSGAMGGVAGSASGAGTTGSFSPSGGARAGDDVARNFLRQCEQYLGVSRSLWDLVGRAAGTADPEQRARLFTEGLGTLQQQFAGLWAATPFGASGAGAANPFAMGNALGALGGLGPMGSMGPMSGMGPFGGMGSMAGMAGMPGMAGLGGMGPGGGAFSLPALGPTRESQESLQRLSQLAMRCWQAQMQVGGQWNDIIGKALRELGERLGPRLKSGTPPASMKEVYDLWVDSAESVYAQSARGAAFLQAQAELTNSLSQLRTAQRELMEEWGKQFDLPTRAEINSIHQQLRELKAALQR